jgi:AraC-like DNA-binding protein
VSPLQPDAPRGVLSPSGEAEGIEHERFLPTPELAPFIAHFWTVRWDRRNRPAFVAETLPHPCVHLLFERGRAQVAGLSTRIFKRRLQGQDRVFGVKFRPATFHPVLGAPLASLRDRVLSLAAVFGKTSNALRDAILEEPDPRACMHLAEAFLRERLPPMPADTARLRDLVERLARDQSITRVEQAAALLGMDVRRLQRRFEACVGVSPKWVIQRYRLHEASERLGHKETPGLAALALELGYFDQPHFSRDFKAVTGRAPEEHVVWRAPQRREPAGRGPRPTRRAPKKATAGGLRSARGPRRRRPAPRSPA